MILRNQSIKIFNLNGQEVWLFLVLKIFVSSLWLVFIIPLFNCNRIKINNFYQQKILEIRDRNNIAPIIYVYFEKEYHE